MEIQPYIRFSMHHTWLSSHYLDREIWDHEIGFIEKGSMRITVDGETHIARENDIFILRPGVHHILEWNGEDCNQPHVHFDFKKQPDSEKVGISFVRRDQMPSEQLSFYREDFFRQNDIDIPVVMHLSNPLKIKNLLFKIIDEFTYKQPASDIVMQGLLTQMIGQILRENSANAEAPLATRQINDIVTFLRKNVDSNLCLSDISAHMNISNWSLIQSFNKYYSCSPMKYYNRLRHIRAMDLLQNSILSISEISAQMNFSEPQTFSRWFKNIDGNYPSTYRKRPSTSCP